jgi:hypothetical protein
VAAEQGARDLAFYEAPLARFVWDCALATIASLAAAVAILMRSRRALLLCSLSLLGVVIQFG